MTLIRRIYDAYTPCLHRLYAVIENCANHEIAFVKRF